jgi:hypothetical protein
VGCDKQPIMNTVTCLSVTLDGVLDWILDLLTTQHTTRVYI